MLQLLTVSVTAEEGFLMDECIARLYRIVDELDFLISDGRLRQKKCPDECYAGACSFLEGIKTEVKAVAERLE